MSDDRDEFKLWFDSIKYELVPKSDFGSFTEDVMFYTWQALTKKYEARISELESIAKTVITESKYCEAYDIGAIRYNSARQELIKALESTKPYKLR